MVNAISIDVEDFFHAANLDAGIGPSRWHRQPCRAKYATERVLALFERCGTKGTFFVLGYTARRFPELIKLIARAGHEIASHGYGHRLVYSQSSDSFFYDIQRSKALLEDLTGEQIHGYRAPNFSITDRCPWAYDRLLEAGYQYDSSVFPTWHPRYANTDKPRTVFTVARDRGSLVVFPLAVAQLNFLGFQIPLPVAGGAYWRLLPKQYNIYGMRQIEKSPEQLGVYYFHPWELDAGQPRVAGLSWLTQFRHYGGTARFESRVESMLKNFSFVPIREAGSKWLAHLNG